MPARQWEPPRPDTVVASAAAPLLGGLPDAWLGEVGKRTLTPPKVNWFRWAW